MTISITPTGATLGATVTGVDLGALDDDTWQEIERAFLDYALLIFPGQRLSADAQLAFAKRFGDIEVLVENMTTIPLSNKAENGKLMDDETDQMKLLKGNEGWHTDSSYMPRSAKASVLSAQVVPAAGGETEWADARAAYDALDAAMKSRLTGLHAVHNYFRSQAKIGHQVAVGAAYGFFEGDSPVHPLVKVHPVTGRPALYVGRHACEIEGMDSDEAGALLASLNEHITQAPFVWRHRWAPGDIAVWDNRALLHRACPYDHGEERLMLHTRIRGDAASETAINYR